MLGLRRWPPPELPDRPYPVLLPYTHPSLFRGRDREVAKLRRLLLLPVPILGLSAVSGAGKSSLLLAGLVPALREEGYAVAVTRHPHEPGLAGRLLGDLLEGTGVGDTDHETFVGRLAEAERLSGGRPAILVLDQFEDVLRRPDAGAERTALGVLLSSTARRRPGSDAPPCRWLLAYRREYHGDAVAWLQDVLRDLRSLGAGGDLPADLSTPDRFHTMTLPPLATAPRGADPLAEATRCFQEAIETPLAHFEAWRFAGDDAWRLARAFGEARLVRPEAPLVPELQVVLAHLLARCEDGVVRVPEEPGALIDQALEEHLRRALEGAFPSRRWPSLAVAQGRSRALLALRELAGPSGRRRSGLAPEALCRAIGVGGEEILEKLAGPLTRLVVLQQRADGWCYVMSHDRMAEVVVRVVEQEGRHGALLVDSELLALRRLVTLSSALYRAGEEEATRLPRRRFRALRAHADAFLWDAERRQWWAACRRRRRADVRRWAGWTAVAALVLAFATLGAWSWAHRLAERRSLLDQVGSGGPEVALAAFDSLDVDPEELRRQLRRRESPLDLLESGMGGVDAARRSAAVLRVAEIALPLVEESPDDAVLLANVVWALDYGPCRAAALADEARSLRDRWLEPLRRQRPPPPAPGPEDPSWASIPGGTFWMGTDPMEGEDTFAVRRHPPHRVTVSAFRLLRHEVTKREYRRLAPGHLGADDLPARLVTWYEAYVYAAWLGGRLPTEAEWEYTALAGCVFEYCNRKGEEATFEEVAWSELNAKDPATFEASVKPVEQLEPNPWGLYDMYGNVYESVADWYGHYSGEPQTDPWGPLRGPGRITRGGAYHLDSTYNNAKERLAAAPNGENPDVGFRVVFPACPVRSE